MINIYLRVVEEQEAFHDQNVGPLVCVGHVGGRRQRDSVGTSKLHRVLNPAFDCVGHGLHIHSCDDYRQRVDRRG